MLDKIKPMLVADLMSDFEHATPADPREGMVGWYVMLDLGHQRGGGSFLGKPYGAWFYELTTDGIWRTDTGHSAEQGVVCPSDWVIGPIDMKDLGG